jgi:hypothetical protein
MRPFNYRVLRKYIKDDSLNFFVDQYLRSLNIHSLYYKETKKDFFILKKIQKGGDLKSVTINKNKYEYDLDTYDDNMDEDNKRKEITIINLEDEGIGCGILIIDKQTNEGNIQSVANYKSCLKCLEKNDDYKTGDIIIQILIAFAKKMKLKKITLEDNSYISCNKIKIPLIGIRTMTKGEPYYCKFGFRPDSKSEKKTYEHNKKIFNSKPTINKDVLLKILLDDVFDSELIKYIKKNIIPELGYKKTSVEYFIKLLITKIIEFDNPEVCKLLNIIHYNISSMVGYKMYGSKKFELKL